MDCRVKPGNDERKVRVLPKQESMNRRSAMEESGAGAPYPNCLLNIAKMFSQSRLAAGLSKISRSGSA